MSDRGVWIWGRHAVYEALRAGGVRRVLLATGRKPAPILRDIERLARERGVPVEEVPPARLQALAPGQSAQGVAAEVVERRASELSDLLSNGRVAPFLLVLDQIQDPHNVGALLRTADASGVHGVILPDRRSAPISGVVAKTSAGAISHLPLLEVGNLARTLDQLRSQSIWVAGLDASGSQLLYDVDLTVPLALVVGGEGTGMRRLTRDRCDLVLKLPMLGSIESLNASVAGAIAMYEVVRQRLRASN
jgi:23S rRNA (guanosine2251-2'-O)-methyltransferase